MISTHILDTSLGQTANGVPVLLEKQDGQQWKQVALEKTDGDGRIKFNCPAVPGVYRLTFQFEKYLEKSGQKPFFLNSPVVFQIENTERKYHIPLLLNPFGYSTYRGS